MIRYPRAILASAGALIFVSSFAPMQIKSVQKQVVAPDPGPTILRRLTRYEYDRTISLLFGIPIKSANLVGMPDEPGGSSFDNLAANLNVPPSLMEKYENAAEKALDQIIGNEKGKVAEIGDYWAAQKSHDVIFLTQQTKDLPRRDAATQILKRFATMAFRRPATNSEIEELLRLFDLSMAGKSPFEKALYLPLKSVLLSPHFLFRIEKDSRGTTGVGMVKVDDYALASRLSFFLWATMPDAELMRAAEEQRLSTPGGLQGELKRMMADPKAKSLTENFADQWLQIRNLPKARPSQEVFPTFDASIREAMYLETATFFDSIRTEDRSVMDLLDADYTYLNENLAKHYGINGVSGTNIRMVKLKSEDHRGGLLGMGSVLAMTSHTYRTSPTLRGKWILEVIYGDPPPPPPPGVSQIADEPSKQKNGTTFRELLAQHANKPGCAGCHKSIDPLGYTLENYDAIGRWRTAEKLKPIDATGQLPTGEKINGLVELKRLVTANGDKFARTIVKQLMTYALGRETLPSDEPAVKKILAESKRDNYRFSAMIEGVVNSVPFLYKRIGAPLGTPGTILKKARS